MCSGQLIPDSKIGFSSTTAGESIFKEAINFTIFNIKRDTSGSVPDAD
jgi:hypothetical protein